MCESPLFRILRGLHQRGDQWLVCLTLRRIQRNRRISAATSPPAPPITCLVDRDPVDPGSQICFAPKPANALEGPQKSFLRQVASFFAVLCQPEQKTVDFAGAVGHPFLESSRLAAL